MDKTHSEQLMSFKNRKGMTEQNKVDLVQRDIHTMGDLTEVRGNVVRWIDLQRIQATFLSGLIANKTPEQTPLHLRQGSCWLVSSDNEEIVYEYVGHIKCDSGMKLMVRKWVTLVEGDSLEEGDRLKLCSTSASRGAGTDLMLNYEDI